MHSETATTYKCTIRESLLSNAKCFAAWLWRYWEQLETSCQDDRVSVKAFKDYVLDIIRPAAAWPGKDAFICDVYYYETKEQLLERCKTAIKNARKIRNT